MSDIQKLMRVEEYLDLSAHDANKGEVFQGNDGGLTEWYEDGLSFISEIIDEIPLYVDAN